MAGDIVSIESDQQPGEPLIQLVMQNGRRLAASPTLAEVRARAARDLDRLPDALRRLEPGSPYPVRVTDALARLASEVDHRLAAHEKCKQDQGIGGQGAELLI
jgi:nicotinate phosphoribosyltransferase